MNALLRHAIPPWTSEHEVICCFLKWQGVSIEYEQVTRLVGGFMEVVIDGKYVVHGFWELVNLWQEKEWARV